MLTFRKMGSPRTYSIVAATKNGVVAEFPDGKRKHAWLLMFPPAIIGDVVVAAITMDGETASRGRGLRNMAQRAQAVGGMLEVVGDERGFGVVLALPVASRDSSRAASAGAPSEST